MFPYVDSRYLFSSVGQRIAREHEKLRETKLFFKASINNNPNLQPSSSTSSQPGAVSVSADGSPTHHAARTNPVGIYYDTVKLVVSWLLVLARRMRE